MNNLQFLLNRLAEESVEIAKDSLKAVEFGLTATDTDGRQYDNKAAIHSEINDLMAIIEMLNEECGFNYKPNVEAIAIKKVKVAKYREHSRKLSLIDTNTSYQINN